MSPKYESAITEPVFASYLDCTYKAFLRLHARKGEQTLLEKHRVEFDTDYQTRAITQLLAAHAPEEINRQRNLNTGVDLAAGHILLVDRITVSDLEAGPTVLCNTAAYSTRLEPCHFCRYPSPSPRDKLILGFKACVVGTVTDPTPSRGHIIYGPNFKTMSLHLSPYLKKAESIISRIRETASAEAQRLYLNSHCEICEFKDACRTKAVEEDNMSLIRGIRPGYIENMNRRGIFTLHQLSYTFRPRKIPKRAKNPAKPRHYALQAQAIREQKVFIHGAPEIPSTTTSLYFDIEGIPERECHYLIGVLVSKAGTSSEYHSFWADDDIGQLDMVLQFCRFVSAFPGCPLMHYGSYDQQALRALGSRVNARDAAIVDRAIDRCCNVLPWAYSHCYFPLHSIKLRTIAAFLGCNFTGPICSGAESIVFREQWETCADSSLLQALLHYNREDCIALEAVTSFLRNARTLALRRQSVPGRDVEMATSETLRRTGEGKRPEFKKAEFVLPAFDMANKCAYFDYQQDRIYARSAKTRRPAKSVRRLANSASRSVRKTIVEISCDVCPHCGSKQLKKLRVSQRAFIDLKYFKGQTGVKQWRPHYVVWQYKCRGCGREIVSPTVNLNMKGGKLKKYGRGVACWCVYHNVIGKQTVLQVVRNLRDLFGIVAPNAYRFRSDIASEYRPLYQEILNAILESPVINIDETPVKLRKSMGYVWVLATADQVLYLFRDSREGAFLHELFEDFRGVLVSDFFTAYDSLPCFHQKCLVHLMRDLNDDMRRHPFDEELRHIAEEFGGFLQKAVASIDRWGLKTYHLRKHKKDSERLSRNVARKTMKSECARKYQSRFTKYENSLFTFLEHDSVPWNNNNAEHAVHHFAKLRRFTNGTFTKSTIEDLLIILSVLQTCEYRRVNPLRFMLSGDVKLSRMR